MADRPTREECIAWLGLMDICMLATERSQKITEAIRHYLTEGATPDMFAVEEHCVHCGYVAALCRCADFADRSVLKKEAE